jgi:NIMA (never in mitosis gene a)-related kinase
MIDMSPEIFQNKPYSYKSDVWALGCVLYEITTLNHAFDSNSLNSLAGKIVKGRYPPISPKYSRSLRELIAQMLLINPQQRPDVDIILRKSFIKKHIINFLADVVSRPETTIGNIFLSPFFRLSYHQNIALYYRRRNNDS